MKLLSYVSHTLEQAPSHQLCWGRTSKVVLVSKYHSQAGSVLASVPNCPSSHFDSHGPREAQVWGSTVGEDVGFEVGHQPSGFQSHARATQAMFPSVRGLHTAEQESLYWVPYHPESLKSPQMNALEWLQGTAGKGLQPQETRFSLSSLGLYQESTVPRPQNRPLLAAPTLLST